MTSISSALRTFFWGAIAALLLTVPALGQDRMPLTTSSNSAKMHFRTALDHLNNVEVLAARDTRGADEGDVQAVVGTEDTAVRAGAHGPGGSHGGGLQESAASETDGVRHCCPFGVVAEQRVS